jgi:tetratricopeptide (TPR) repeat protein
MRADAAGAAQEAFAEEDSVIVTGTRARNAKATMRGDWNACTVNDPQQNLRGCAGLIRGKAAENIESGLTQAWSGDMKEAIAEFDRAIAAAPRNAFAWLNRGLAHQREGDLDRALADLDQAIRLDPDSARAYYSRSIVLHQRGETRRATRDAQRAIDIDPQYKDVAR